MSLETRLSLERKFAYLATWGWVQGGLVGIFTPNIFTKLTSRLFTAMVRATSLFT